MFHIVVTGGQSKGDSLTGLNGIAVRLGGRAPIMVWVNEYFGQFAATDGIPIEKTGVYAELGKKIFSVLTIPERPAATFGRDISEMLSKNDLRRSNSVKGLQHNGQTEDQDNP
ncbi:MAG TPA: hypothetical protein VE954_35180 [Oligoflexus sp.]|uniref:hypothetical protein n=1 Tax=Oligoflexus sp. TaxID=1971216 RepID=UPI002D25A792|nr:hypothetical protein [Oligoflexus sp.]HYX38376.1 hypothetical protein [Oligoflexus sp.]